MMKAYLLTIDETGKHVRKLVTCEKCFYFHRARSRDWRRDHICLHPDGMVNPMPDFFCPLGKEGAGNE